MEQRVVAPAFVQHALDCLEAAGFNAAPVVVGAGLQANCDEAVSNESYGRLWRLIARTMDDEFFGLAARPMRSGSFALLCHALIGTNSLEHAMRRALRFLRVVLDDPHGELEVRNGLAVVRLHDDRAGRPAFAYRTFWVILMGVSCWLIGRRIPLRSLDFACEAPASRSDYQSFFGAPVRFEQPTTTLVFDASYLKLPVIRSEQSLTRFLNEAPANILVRYRQEFGVASRVRGRLAGLAPADWPTFDILATTLGVPPATLRRRLKEDGQSYQSIKDELRLVAAQKLLMQGGKTMATVAAELGYSEPSAFYRAFLKRTGTTPRGFRENARR